MTATGIMHDVVGGVAAFVAHDRAFGRVFTVGGDGTPALTRAEAFLVYVLGLGFEPADLDPATLDSMRSRWEAGQ